MAAHQKRRDEIATLKATVKQKECEIAELSSYMECLKAELDLLKPRADKYAHDCECYRQQYVALTNISYKNSLSSKIHFIYNVGRRFSNRCCLLWNDFLLPGIDASNCK